MKGNRIKMSLLVFVAGDILILSQEIAYFANEVYLLLQVSSTSFDLKSIYWGILKELIYFIIMCKKEIKMKKSLLLPIHLKAQYLLLKWLNVPSWRSIRSFRIARS